jgi:tRNA (guanine37-N1)-methyltransferase
MLRCDIITIFPEFFGAVFDVGIIRRAKLAGLVEITPRDLRQWAHDKHRIVDDRPFGGGDGMVLKPEPLFEAIEALTGAARREDLRPAQRVVMLTPQGRTLTQPIAAELARAEQLVFICGRYEGVDERVIEAWTTDEISIGDYVLSGGEAAAVVVTDAVVRLLPGALGSETSAVYDSFSDGSGLLDCPQYTRPPEFKGMSVPEVLLGGNHAAIARWRHEKALEKTRRNRPDLLL